MLRAAVIGCGRMGAEPSERLEGLIPPGWIPISHVESFIQAKDVELVALSELDPVRLEWAGEFYHISALFENYNDLLKTVSPDIIGVATRTPEKLNILQAACNCGIKGAYVEKPFANTLQDTRKILDDAKNANVVVSYGVNRRYHSVYRHARDLIRSGEIGDLLEIVIEFGEGPLLWSHPHSVDLMVFLSGQCPIEAQAELRDSTVVKLSDSIIDSDPVISYAHFWFDGGAHGLIVRGGGCSVRANGTHGSLEILSDGASIYLRKSNGQQKGYFLLHQTIFPVMQRSATVVALEELVKNINGELTESISHDEIYFGMQMLWGCVFSHLQKGIKCRLADMPNDLTITGRLGDLYA
jgi:scyllo-inositol 2-dehydrogenase (NAD+)